MLIPLANLGFVLRRVTFISHLRRKKAPFCGSDPGEIGLGFGASRHLLLKCLERDAVRPRRQERRKEGANAGRERRQVAPEQWRGRPRQAPARRQAALPQTRHRQRRSATRRSASASLDYTAVRGDAHAALSRNVPCLRHTGARDHASPPPLRRTGERRYPFSCATRWTPACAGVTPTMAKGRAKSLPQLFIPPPRGEVRRRPH